MPGDEATLRLSLPVATQLDVAAAEAERCAGPSHQQRVDRENYGAGMYWTGSHIPYSTKAAGIRRAMGRKASWLCAGA